MNKKWFEGFDQIKADRVFREKLKSEMLDTLQNKKPKWKKRKAAIIAIPATAIIAALVLVITMPNAVSNQFILPVKAQDLMQGVKARQVNVSDAVTQNFLKSTQGFSIRLLQAQYTDGKNNLVSPASAYFCLGMAGNGAGGTTRTEFQDVLGQYGMTMDGLNRAYKAYADDLTTQRGSTGIVLSNSIWLRTGLRVKKSFLQDNADYFGAGAHTLDFDAGAVKTINNWVKNSTKGRIDSLIDRFNPNDELYLINALTFDGKWKYPFDTDGPAAPGNFDLENGKTVKMSFMGLAKTLGCIQSADETAVVLPYDDDRFAMLCILPKEGVSLKKYVANMTENTIPVLMQKQAQTFVIVSLPQFKITSDEVLNGALSKMGLANAFGDADFSGITGDRTLYISQVRQKTYLEVNELGTKAAAATAAEFECKGVVDGKYIDFNRPFVFALVDLKTNLPLFIGTKQE